MNDRIASLCRIFLLLGIAACLSPRPGLSAGGQAQTCNAGAALQGVRQLKASGNVRAAVAGDFNRDGRQDMVFSEAIGTFPIVKLNLWLGDGQGGFENVAGMQGMGLFYDVDAGDLNGDGILDLIGSGGGFGPDTGAAAYLGNGDGTFRLLNTIATGPGQVATAVADFNGDGRADVAVGNQFSGNLFISLAAADGKLGAPVRYIAPVSPIAVNAADLNGDGKADLMTSSPNVSTVGLLINNGSGGFSPVPGPETGGNVFGATTGDFTGDGRTDLAVAQSDAISILAGDGRGGFGAAKKIRAGGANAILARDLSGDGKDDLIASATSLAVLVNDGAGNFQAVTSYGGAGPAGAPLSADFNGDGRPDLVLADPNSDRASILLNLGAAVMQAPRVSDPAVFPAVFYLGDLNKDGRPDAVSSANFGFEVAIGDGRGGFGAPRFYDDILDFAATAAVVTAGDFNRDGNLDLAFAGPGRANSSTGSVIVAFADAAGAFSPARLRKLTVGERPADLLAVDFTGDGALDLVSANAGSNDLSLLRGDGTGGFNTAPAVPAGLEPSSLAAADFNGDGRIDLAVANRNSVVLTLLLAEPQGGFSGNLIAIGANPGLVKAGDVNGDGKNDLVVAQTNAGLVTVLLGNGTGGFSAPLNNNVGGVVYAMALADFNGDARPDLALSRFAFSPTTENRMQLYLGNGTGVFSAAAEFLAPAVRQVVAADLNEDRLPDLVFISASGGAGKIWSLLGQCNPPPANVLVSVSAASFRRLQLAPDSIVAAFGPGLAAQTVAATSLPLPVQLGGASVIVKDRGGVERPAPLFFVSPLQINYLMPPATAPGTAAITVNRAGGGTIGHTAEIAAIAPGLFTANADGQGAPAGVVLRVQADGRQTFLPLARFDPAANQFVPEPIDISVLRPSLDRIFLLLFGTGLRGATQANVSVQIGLQNYAVLYAGPAPGLLGVDQINLEFQRGTLPGGEYDLQVTANGRLTNTVRVRFGN